MSKHAHWGEYGITRIRMQGITRDKIPTSHRRLRKPKGPRWALIVPSRISHEEAAQIKAQWQAVQRKDTVVLANGFDVRRLR